MGYSLSWAAVRNGTAETVCSACNLRQTGKREELPESDIVGAEIPGGWQLVLYNKSELDYQVLAKLSAENEVVSCFVEDHVMFSSASGWVHGKQAWRVFHDCEKGRYHLEITGAPPAVLADIRNRLTEKQDADGGENADVDHIYDIPAELAKALTGFRHDEDVQGAAGNVYQVLESTVSADGWKGLVARLTSVLKGSSRWSVAVLLAFAILLAPVLIVAALIASPCIWALKVVRKARVKRVRV